MLKILAYSSYIWVLTELILMLTKRSKSKSVKKKADKGSLILIWVIMPLAITAGFNLAKGKHWAETEYIIFFFGLTIFLVGFIIRWTTIFQLKKAFTVDVAINQTHELKTDGLFRIVRHPSYFGLVLIVSGLSIGMNSIFSVIVVIVPVFLAIIYRIYVEENLLLGEFGEQYEEYKNRTRKIIPYIY